MRGESFPYLTVWIEELLLIRLRQVMLVFPTCNTERFKNSFFNRIRLNYKSAVNNYQ